CKFALHVDRDNAAPQILMLGSTTPGSHRGIGRALVTDRFEIGKLAILPVSGERTMQQDAARKYYFVSDLHMGGDGQLQHCDYTAEFVAFLKQLEKAAPETELLIVGDTFGFWELTLVQGADKLDHIIAAHQAIFDQLHATGTRIKITMMVGN